MTFAQRLLPLALLSIASHYAEAAGSGSIDRYTAIAGSAASASAIATLASAYFWGGIRKSDSRPAAQFSVDAPLPSGWSAGSWASSIGERAVAGGWFESDLYGGHGGSTASGIGYGATAYYDMVPGARGGGNGRGGGEVAAGLSDKVLHARYDSTSTRDFFGIADARASGDLGARSKRELAGVMTRYLRAVDGRVAGDTIGGMDWHDLKAGLSRKFEGGWALSGTYSRAFGAGAAVDRYASAMPRADLRPLSGSKSRSGALVMTLSRRF